MSSGVRILRVRSDIGSIFVENTLLLASISVKTDIDKNPDSKMRKMFYIPIFKYILTSIYSSRKIRKTIEFN